MKNLLTKITKALSVVTLIIATIVITLTVFIVGYVKGYAFGKNNQLAVDQKVLSKVVSATTKPINTSVPFHSPLPTIRYSPPTVSWGGPQLWDAVNKSRVEHGVNPLKVMDQLCTIASIRLNEILDLGKLDGHAGFSVLADRPDIKPTFDKYNISEFLVSGASSPQNAVGLWENTLGHKILLSGGEYVWGCVYAQNGFGVAIAAY